MATSYTATSTGAAAPATSAVASPKAAHHSSRPITVPALRHWRPVPGRWRLGAHPRITVVGTLHYQLVTEARHLADDLRPVLHRRLPVRAGPASLARPGDIRIRRTPPQHRLGRPGYALRVGSRLTIAAHSRDGVFYGGRSVIQLLHQHRWVHRGRARDWPTYRQRGLMVDVSRTIYTRDWLVREIHELALLKLDVLHLHLTDDQRWGVTSHTYPGVVGARPLTRADLRAILRLAHRNHVRVIPEIDMPGHMAAFLAKHPKLELKPAGVVAGEPRQYLTDKLDITQPAVLRAVHRMLGEYLPLFPGKYWDLGTDEYLTPAEEPAFPQLAAYAVRKYGPGATASDAVHGFINWVNHIVRRNNKVLRVWNDQLGGTGVVPVDRNVVVDWWTSSSPFGDLYTVSPKTLLLDGYRVFNAGWYPNYYTADIGPIGGKADMAKVYRQWQVNEFDGPETKSGPPTTRQRVPAHSRRLLGDGLSIWGPLPEKPRDTARHVAPRLAVIAQKTWDSRPLVRSYRKFRHLARRVGAS
jgi:hexosaminidase